MKGLWRALQYHQFYKKRKFTTSLYLFVDWECLKELNRIKKNRRTQPIDSIASEVADRSDREEIQHLYECLNQLSDKELQLIRQWYFDDMTMEEIGKLHGGITREAIRQKIKKAVQNLSDIYTKP